LLAAAEEPLMKKLMIVLICGLVLAPLAAWGQTWVEPYTAPDGTQVPGHWQTPEDVRQERNTTPGTINPYTGQFNPFTSRYNRPPAVNPTPTPPTPTGEKPMKQNPYYSLPDYQYHAPDYRYQGNK
jgi:hypothetical protein